MKKGIVFMIFLVLPFDGIANDDDSETCDDEISCSHLIQADCIQCFNHCCLVVPWALLVCTCELIGKHMYPVYDNHSSLHIEPRRQRLSEDKNRMR